MSMQPTWLPDEADHIKRRLYGPGGVISKPAETTLFYHYVRCFLYRLADNIEKSRRWASGVSRTRLASVDSLNMLCSTLASCAETQMNDVQHERVWAKYTVLFDGIRSKIISGDRLKHLRDLDNRGIAIAIRIHDHFHQRGDVLRGAENLADDLLQMIHLCWVDMVEFSNTVAQLRDTVLAMRRSSAMTKLIKPVPIKPSFVYAGSPENSVNACGDACTLFADELEKKITEHVTLLTESSFVAMKKDVLRDIANIR